MGGHQSGKMLNDEWLTPQHIKEPLGQFTTDPCSPEVRPWDTAQLHYSKVDDGLVQPWFGRVWLNPPYGRDTATWLNKMALHNFGTALIFARTETDMFFKYVWGVAEAVLFIKGRLHFCDVKGVPAKANSGAPSVLIAYGAYDAFKLEQAGIPGKFIKLKS